MKKSQEKLKAEYMAEAEAVFDELMKWDEENFEPDLTQIEDIVLKLRKQFGERMAQAIIEMQEKRQPAEKMICPKCYAWYDKELYTCPHCGHYHPEKDK